MQIRSSHEESRPTGAAFRLAIGLTFAGVTQAQAYTDPGSGALILQIASAAVVGSLFYWRKVLGYVRRLVGRKRLPD